MPKGERGFSIIELMMVVAVIGILAAVSGPPILNYLRVYGVRSAAALVAGEVQTARTQAIKRNTNNGVVFVILSPTTYRYFGQDAPGMTSAPSGLAPAQRRNMAQSELDGLAGTIRTLPRDTRFRTGGAGSAFCFDRLGMRQSMGSVQCPAVADIPAGNYLVAPGADTQIIIERETLTAVTRTVTIGSGGRVIAQ